MSAAAASSFVHGLNDPRLKPRFLRFMLRDFVPLADGANGACKNLPSSADIEFVFQSLVLHGLLDEQVPAGTDPPDTKLADAWHTAVDAWVERLLALLSSNFAHNKLLGTWFLGVTFQECSSSRFVTYYADWFEKIMLNLQAPSSARLVNASSFAALADLFVRSSKHPHLKKEATSFAGRVVQPVLTQLKEDGPAVERALDLLYTTIKFYSSAVRRFYDEVECALLQKIIGLQCSPRVCNKCSSCLALLPNARGGGESWHLLMLRILVAMNVILDEAFLGMEGENEGSEIRKLLVPPGKCCPPLLGDKARSSHVGLAAAKYLRLSVFSRVSALLNCCCAMLSESLNALVTVPVRGLLATIRRVLLVEGSLINSALPAITSLHQEIICSQLPSLHVDTLDLLVAVIEGMRRQILPHAAKVVCLITEYIGRAALPLIRVKVYSVVRLLLTSLGVGVALDQNFLYAIVTNVFGDLKDKSESNSKMVSADASNGSNAPKQKHGGSRKRKHTKNNDVDSDGSVLSSKKQLPSTSQDHLSDVAKAAAPLSVKIAALQAMEALLNVAGSVSSASWRSDMDLLLITLARVASKMVRGSRKRFAASEELTAVDLQVATLKALLASLLSTHVFPPTHLAQGIELFTEGKLQIGTEVAEFCTHALRSLDFLVHPQVSPDFRNSTADNKHNPVTAENDYLGGWSDPASSKRADLGKTSYMDEDYLSHWAATNDESHICQNVAPTINQGVGSSAQNPETFTEKCAGNANMSPGASRVLAQTLRDSDVKVNDLTVETGRSSNLEDFDANALGTSIDAASPRRNEMVLHDKPDLVANANDSHLHVHQRSSIPAALAEVTTPPNAATGHQGVDIVKKSCATFTSPPDAATGHQGVDTVTKSCTTFTSASSSHTDLSPEKATKDVASTTAKMMTDSDSESLVSIPDIIDGDPDSDGDSDSD